MQGLAGNNDLDVAFLTRNFFVLILDFFFPSTGSRLWNFYNYFFEGIGLLVIYIVQVIGSRVRETNSCSTWKHAAQKMYLKLEDYSLSRISIVHSLGLVDVMQGGAGIPSW